MSNLTEDQFLKDVAQHVMEVLRDDGLYRHIRFRKPGTMCMHFDLITWPGYLCYSGDMGTYVFARLADMFEFFRTDRRPGNGRRLGVNLQYWSEKLQAVDGGRRNGSAQEFSEAKMRRVINEFRLRWIRDARAEDLLTMGQRRELWGAVQDDVLARLPDGEHEAYAAAMGFQWKPSRHYANTSLRKREWQFDDLWEYDFTEYTHRFHWCCFALSWGIEKYDAIKATMADAADALS